MTRATLTVLATMPSAGQVSHPDMSPDVTQLAYVGTGTRNTDFLFGGGGKLSKMMGDLGRGIKNFKKGVKDDAPQLTDKNEKEDKKS